MRLQVGEIKALAGVDFLTIAPALLEQLKNEKEALPKKLDAKAGMFLTFNSLPIILIHLVSQLPQLTPSQRSLTSTTKPSSDGPFSRIPWHSTSSTRESRNSPRMVKLSRTSSERNCLLKWRCLDKAELVTNCILDLYHGKQIEFM